MKVVAESDAIHHLVEAGVARHLERIRKVEVADAESNLPGVRETKLRAEALLKGEIQVGAIGRESLLSVSDAAALQREVGLQELAVSLEHAEADRRDSETGYRRVVVAQTIAVFVLDGGLPQESNRQNLANVIHACTDEFAPGIPVVLEAGNMEVAPSGVGEDVPVAERGFVFEGDFGFGR